MIKKQNRNQVNLSTLSMNIHSYKRKTMKISKTEGFRFLKNVNRPLLYQTSLKKKKINKF